MSNIVNEKNMLKSSIKECKKAFWITFGFAFMVNLLMTVQAVYSLQVLNRVLSSGSMETLFWLTVAIFVIYATSTLIQVARSFTLIKVGEWLDKKLAPVLFSQSVSIAAIRQGSGASQNLRDLETVKSFLSSIGINTLFDAPWAIVYFVMIFSIHPYFGYLGIVGVIIVLIFAFINSYSTDSVLSKANEENIKSMVKADIAARNAEVIEAMGMMQAVVQSWKESNKNKLDFQSIASYRNGVISNVAKFLRSILQVLVTAIGAYLVVSSGGRELNAGQMIAASIVIGRALAPFDGAIDAWKSIANAKKSYEKISNAFEMGNYRDESMSLPVPKGALSVENVLFAVPSAPNQAPRYTIKGISFALDAGDILAVIGASAAGKTTLAKLLVGIWKPTSGIVRLDGANVFTWRRDEFGKHAGYLPQTIELFSGSVKDNIARLDPEADPEKIVEAAKMTGAHDFILRLPNGYETDIGVAGSSLSAGQRQRVGLARAFYGDPKLVVLDEPNANLDELGEQALAGALKNAKAKKITTIVISHRPSVLSSVDKILIVQDGMVAAFGARDEILTKFAATQQQKPS